MALLLLIATMLTSVPAEPDGAEIVQGQDREPQYAHRGTVCCMLLRACYAVPGTDVASGATSAAVSARTPRTGLLPFLRAV
eukprot:594837-Rhodomonas_salina.1